MRRSEEDMCSEEVDVRDAEHKHTAVFWSDDHAVFWSDDHNNIGGNPVEEALGHFSSPDQKLQNPYPSSLGGFCYQSSDETRVKRMKLSPFNQEEMGVNDAYEETSSLGLTLHKSPSLIDLVEKRLSEGRRSSSNTPPKLDRNSSDHNHSKKSTSKSEDYGSQPMSEKLKASNFPAMYLKIGKFEKTSKNEGDLVAKCYYAKKKLVWEILEGALKSKIEIQWSDIVGIRASMIEDQPGILEIELGQRPSFFRETNPQPRKHTLWEAAQDITGGVALTYSIHYVMFAPGVLDKHYEKLLQCHPHLLTLSQKRFPSRDSPYFPPNSIGFPEISIDFDSCGGPSWHGLHYTWPLHVHVSLLNDWRRSAPPASLCHMDPISQFAVNALGMENGRMPRWGDANFVEGNRKHALMPVLSPATHASSNFSFNDTLSPYGEEPRMPNAIIMGSLNHIANQLLGDNQGLCDEDVAQMKQIYESYGDPENYESYGEPKNWDFNEGFDGM